MDFPLMIEISIDASDVYSAYAEWCKIVTLRLDFNENDNPTDIKMHYHDLRKENGQWILYEYTSFANNLRFETCKVLTEQEAMDIQINGVQ
jgi:hypothetical protein